MAIDRIELTAGMRANLLSLKKTASSIDLTASRLSTGLKVQTALDDPIAYFAAQGHTQRASDLAMRKDEMGEAIQTIKAANNGIEGLTDMLSSLKSIAQSALSAEGTDAINSLETQYNTIIGQINDLVDDSFYKGINLLSDEDITVNFDELGNSTLTVSGFDASASGLGLNTAIATNDWVSATTAGTADTVAVNADIDLIDTALTTLRTETKSLSNNLSVITIREDFTDNMINTLEEGAANLTLADLDEEGANLLMLQTRQALAQTALSITSQAAQGVLRLF